MEEELRVGQESLVEGGEGVPTPGSTGLCIHFHHRTFTGKGAGGAGPPGHAATEPEGQGLWRTRLRSERPREVRAEPGEAKRRRARHGQDS